MKIIIIIKVTIVAFLIIPFINNKTLFTYKIVKNYSVNLLYFSLTVKVTQIIDSIHLA